MKSSRKRTNKISTISVELRSVSDLARNCSLHGDVIRPIISVRRGDVHRLMATHVKLGDSKLLLFVDSKEGGRCIVYQPKSDFSEAVVEIRAQQPTGPQNNNMQCIPIMELGSIPFEEAKKQPKINSIRATDLSQFLKAIIARAMEHDTVGKVYAFRYGSERYVGAFGLIDDDEIRSFTYARMDTDKDYSFFRYNYSTDKVEPTDSFGDPSYIYVRIVNLAEPFKFFKPE